MSSVPALKRVRWVFALLVALATAAVLAPMAAAGMGGPRYGDPHLGKAGVLEPIQWPADPLTTNVPYLAWRGEHVRVMKCWTLYNPDSGEPVPLDEAERLFADIRIALSNPIGQFEIEDWSGDPHIWPVMTNDLDGNVVPLLQETVISKRGERPKRAAVICVSVDMTSQKAGLAMVKLSLNWDIYVSERYRLKDVLISSRTDISQQPLDVHQFLVAWMTLNNPVIANKAKTDLIAGDSYTPGKDQDEIIATVTGTIPMGNNFKGFFTGDVVTLPADWKKMADTLGVDGDNPAAPSMGEGGYRWDIHDDTLATEGHPNAGYPCDDEINAALTVDAVDNCPQIFEKVFDWVKDYDDNFFSATIGFKFEASNAFQFSTIDGGYTAPLTIGPFDPIRALETSLADGKVDAGDAPMPSARVDFYIADPATDKDLGGVGYFSKVSKRDVYSRDGEGDAAYHDAAGDVISAGHNLYAPYYYTYLPATEAPGFLDSGIAGPRHGNNFVGFLDGGRAHERGDHLDAKDGRDDFELVTDILGGNPYIYWRFADRWYRDRSYSECLWYVKDHNGAPSRIKQEDELKYRPNPYGVNQAAVYTDEHGEARINYNSGLGYWFDLLGKKNGNGGCDLQGVNDLGYANVHAVARYPYQPVLDTVKKSNVIRFNIDGRFNKVLRYDPKGPNDIGSRIVTVTATDIDGQPIAWEKVCLFSASDGVVRPSPGTHSYVNKLGEVCVWTDENGQATVEVFGRGEVFVVADFPEERLKRYLTVNFNAASGGATLPDKDEDKKPDNSAPKGPGVNTPSTAQLAAAGASTAAPAKLAVVKKAKLIRVKVAKKLFKNFVVVKVDSPSDTAKIRVKIFNRFGKVVVNAVRTVETGIELRVPNLKVPASGKAVKVQILA